MPRISKRVLTFRERQRRGAIMHPSTFAEIEREAAAGGARDPRAVAGAAYWKTLAARYRGNPISEEPDPRYPGELRFVEWRRAMLTFINSHWYGGTLSDAEFRHIAHLVHMPPEAGADWSFIRDADDQDVIAVFLYVQGRHPELGPHRGFNPGKGSVERVSERSAKVVTAKGHVDYPIRYDDGRIAYDFPERVPAYLKKQVARMLAKPRGNPRGKQRKFKDVAVGESFEFWDPWHSMMTGPWIKKSARTYVRAGESKTVYRVGSISAKVLPDGVLSNPDDELPEAERLYETFHGREPREILELTESAVSRGEYAALGDLVELTIVTPGDQQVKVGFKNDGVRLASTAEGTQLVLLGGNQDISGTLGMFGSADTSKDLLDLGEAKQIVYDAAKWQTDFTPQEWKHDFGEESGIRPRVFFDQLNKRLMFAGGTYRVERPGIVD